MVSLRIDLRRLRWVLGAVVLALSVSHMLVTVVMKAGTDLFNLNEESNLGTWCSTAMLALVAIGFWFNGRTAPRPTRIGWHLGAAIMGLMSVDEVARLHERTGQVLSRHEGARGPLLFAWVIPGSIIAVVLLVSLVLFARRLDRSVARWLVVGAVLFFGGAVGVEMVGGNEISNGVDNAESVTTVEHSRSYLFTTGVEETLELVGEAVLVFTVARAADDVLAAGDRRMAGVEQVSSPYRPTGAR